MGHACLLVETVNRGPTEAERVRSLRDVLTATGAGIYLSTHLAGPIPAEVMTAVHESDDLELRIGRAGPDRDDDLEQREKEARAVVAAAIKASPERIVLTHGAPEAISAVVLRILADHAETGGQRGSRLIAVDGLAPALVVTLEAVAAACGARVELVDSPPRIIASDVAVLLMAHVDPDGDVADLKRVAEAAHKAGARLVVDASLSVGAVPLEATTCGADVLVADTNRWLLGPEAMTLVWLSPAFGDAAARQLREAVGPFGRGALLALARSVGWLLMYVDLPWVLARTAELTQRVHDRLAAIDGIELLTDRRAHAALVAFRVADWDAVQAAEELSRSVFAILEADAERDVLRVSVGAWNREDELDRFIARVTELADETPETLTRRPSLTVLSSADLDGHPE